MNLYRVYNIEGEEKNSIKMRQEIALLQEKLKNTLKEEHHQVILIIELLIN